LLLFAFIHKPAALSPSHKDWRDLPRKPAALSPARRVGELPTKKGGIFQVELQAHNLQIKLISYCLLFICKALNTQIYHI